MCILYEQHRVILLLISPDVEVNFGIKNLVRQTIPRLLSCHVYGSH
jgi:hypothetical protein